jgi:hypothetical protein
MQWFRMYAEFATDPKVQSMDETLQRRFTMFLCLHCSGEYEALSDDELACALRITTDEVVRTKEVFRAKGFLDAEFKIRNWNKRQYKSDDVNARVKKHRDEKRKQTCNVSVTPSETDTESEAETDSEKKKKSEVPDTSSGGVGGDASRKRSAEPRGSRLPTPFLVTKEMRAWATEKAPHVNLESATEDFCNYWRALPGARGRKLDWVLTWKNRMKECEDKAVRRGSNGKGGETISERFERVERELDQAGVPRL